MLGVEKATVVRIKGTTILSSKEYNKETFDASQHVIEEENSTRHPEEKFLKF